jgi:uncharacterized protein YqeY
MFKIFQCKANSKPSIKAAINTAKIIARRTEGSLKLQSGKYLTAKELKKRKDAITEYEFIRG